MDTAILSATSALVGSLIGALSTLAASWLTLRGRVRAQALVHEAAKREALYAEFIIEASRRPTDAWAHQAEICSTSSSVISTPANWSSIARSTPHGRVSRLSLVTNSMSTPSCLATRVRTSFMQKHSLKGISR
jgi:hypothetical protein